VENKPGALAADRHIDFRKRLNLLNSNIAQADGSLYVRYFSDEELLAMARGAGLKAAAVSEMPLRRRRYIKRFGTGLRLW